MGELVSIIVPVYNKEHIIMKCLNSLLRINYSKTEFIIVDDGSSDKSSYLCQKICDSDDRFRYYRKENGGVSSARNYGLKMAQGELVFFVDADDTVSPNIINETLTNLGNSDCLIFSCFSDYSVGNVIDHSVCGIYSIGDFFNAFLKKYNSYVMNNPWNKVYRSRIIHENNLKFDETMNLGEDLCFNINYYMACNCIKIINTQLYYYTYSESGLTNCKREYLELWKSEYKMLINIKKAMDTINQINYNVGENYIFNRLRNVLSGYLDKCDYKQCIILRRQIINDVKELSILKTNASSIKILLYIFFSPVIYLKKRIKRSL